MSLIEKLEKERDSYYYESNTFLDRESRNIWCAIDDCINIVKQHSDWISTNERLPEHGEYILVYDKHWQPKFLTRTYRFKNGFFYEYPKMIAGVNPEYWMPLPLPPVEVS